MYFDWGQIEEVDQRIAERYLGWTTDGQLRQPDLIIAPDGRPYLYRWHIARGAEACVYFHIQVASDPERPLHDHPWDNMTVVLGGAGYEELFQMNPPFGFTGASFRRPGDVVFRPATMAHRLLIPLGGRYTMTQFSTGPKIRGWGFWSGGKFVPYQEVTSLEGNVSVQKAALEARHGHQEIRNRSNTKQRGRKARF